MSCRRALTMTGLSAVVAAALGLFPVAAARASCAGPAITTDPTRDSVPASVVVLQLSASRVTVRGTGFVDVCADTSMNSGCGEHPTRRAHPLRDVPLVLEQAATSQTLGTSLAARDPSYPIRWDVTVPADFGPGPATLQAGSASLAVELR